MRRALLLAFLVLPGVARAQEAATPWLGIAIGPGAQGVAISDVFEQTPAMRAGLKTGDEVIAVDNTPVKAPADFLAIEEKKGVGAKLQLSVLRGGKTLQLTLPLEPRPDQLKLLRDHLIDKTAPGFALAEAQGPYPADLKALGGQVVLVEFSATWCPSCNESIPRLSEWQQKYAKDGLRIVSLSSEKMDKISAHAKKKNIGYTVACDKNSKVLGAYGVPAIPTFVVVDRAGTVRYVGVGAGAELDSVEAAITKLLR